MWTAITEYLAENWLPVLGFVVFLVAVAVYQYVFFGKWGMMASLAYRAVYLGLLSLIICMAGPEILAASWFSVLGFGLYVISFEVVGFWLKVTGIKGGHRRSRIIP